ncbi:MAG: DNA polymerase III subunit gamma/tau [Anaerovoracaceae bacterium]|jgi:DNA polymerase III subunit gamma/tau
MHKALYREFRPSTFDELIGQPHIVRILKSQIASGNTSHAYLFSGTRGTGKTTTARILAKALNCTGEGEKPCGECSSCRAIADGSFIDVIEIDAASNNGVDNIRELTDSVMYAPAVGKYKVYIIDEVHMLSQGAFNALLKTLEEPPEYVVFILATTEPQKVPATILSRCMRLDFRRVSEKALMDNMRRICDIKGIEAEDGALALIAVNADGSVRDSLSILEQCICPGEPLRRDDAAAVLGTAGEESLLQLTDRVIDCDTSGALLLLNDIINTGADVRSFMKEWLEHFRNLLLAKYVDNPGSMLNMSDENAARLIDQAHRISRDFLSRAITEITGTISQTRWSSRPRVMLEMSIVKLCEPEEDNGNRLDGRQGGGTAAPDSRRNQESSGRPQDRGGIQNRAQNRAQNLAGSAGSAVQSAQAPQRQTYQNYEARNENRADGGQADAVAVPHGDSRHGDATGAEESGMQPDPGGADTGAAERAGGYAASDGRQSGAERGGAMNGADRQLGYEAPYGDQNQRAQTGAPRQNPPEQPATAGEQPADTSKEIAFTDADWKKALETTGNKQKSNMFFTAERKTQFVSEKDGTINVSCNENDQKIIELVQKNRGLIEQTIERQTGRHFSISIVPEEARDKKNTDEEKRQELNAFFDCPVDIN